MPTVASPDAPLTRPSTDPADYQFVHQIRTRFAETDAMGIIHHGAYLPLSRRGPRGHAPPCRSSLRRSARPAPTSRCSRSTSAYRRPLYFDETVDIGVVVGDLTRTTFQMGYLLQVDGEIRSTAVSVHGAVTPDGKPGRMPAWLAGVIDPATPSR